VKRRRYGGDAEPRWHWKDEMSLDPTIDVYAYRVAGALCADMDRHTGETTKGTALLVAQTGLDERTVLKALRRLEESGWIARDPGKGGRGRGALTRLRYPNDAAPLPFDPPSATPPREVFEEMRRVLKGGTA
jgi:hypothetical protein